MITWCSDRDGTSADEASANKAIQIISDLTATAEIGKTYLGKVVRLVDFGAGVEIFPAQGLLCWPLVDPWAPEAVVVRFTAGQDVGDVAPVIKAAMKLAIGHLYANREIAVAGRIADLPLTITDLLLGEQWV